MSTHVTGQKAIDVAATPTTYRRPLMDLLGEAIHVITDEEYERAVQNILACQDVATLQKWYRNCIREIARREEAAAIPAPVQYATAQQTDEIHRLSLHRVISKGERTQAILHLPRLDYAAAVALIGELWGKIMLRTGEAVAKGEDAQRSYSSAA